MDFATRQSAPSGFLFTDVTPSTYRGQWLATHSGRRKLAEIGFQPRFAASVTPFECGATAVTTIGGGGFLEGLVIAPCPISRIWGFSGVAGKNCPRSRYGGPPLPKSGTPFIYSGEKGVWVFF